MWKSKKNNWLEFKIGLQLWRTCGGGGDGGGDDDDDDDDDISKARESIKENMKSSATENLGYCVLE
jgi:hypothetical protein